ncbi:hypothetical protein HCN44_005273 [Aphidius gifuensis]|uniref:GPN-loop GTPase 3 n=1 Tax=Aphidius gifuensis TaxID=684658 RepID=A0A834Y2U4_APHGI|nr:GPN-loop GTPase 3 [Aphidius gifuensis]KAF7996996.1 hypothetical protein HCN44_005273 [Aphidius gifuensis]
MRYGQLVLGPAGSGKSTYCATIKQHFEDAGKVMKVVNLDPAAEYFDYEPIVDIRSLISVDDAMEDETYKYGPNGGLVFCMEYLVANSNFLQEELDDDDDDYILFDCPGQIELYTHMKVMRDLIKILEDMNFRLCSVFVVDSQFMVDASKFLSGTMAALSVMINLELPHVNILSKIDLLSKSSRKQLENYLEPDPDSLMAETNDDPWHKKYRNLTEALGKLIEDYSLVRFLPLNKDDEENIADIVMTIDNMIQFGEDADVKMKDYADEAENDD